MSTNKNYLYSFEDVQKQAKDYGFEDSYMSEADWDLARKDPNRGMALVNAKNDWLTAETPEQKAWSHALAEDIRQQGGGYSGGADGSKFVPTGTADYEDPWEQTIQSTVRNLQNKKFEWSPETDPTVKYYEDAYRREGERAMKDTLGAVAATTGGIPSSYATAAAAQQRNYYAQQMADKYPELYQQAFDRFMQEYDREYNMLSAYGDLSELGYGRWSDKQERDRNARLDMADAEQRAFENQYMLDELGLKERAQDHTEAIDWAQIGLQDKDMQQKYELAYAELNQNDRHFVDELLYKYDVMTEEGRQFWAKLAQDGEIADAEIKYKYDALDQDTRNFLMEYALDVDKLEFEKDVHADEMEIAQQEIDYNWERLREDARQFDISTEQAKIIADMEDLLARDKITASKDAEKLEMATVAASYGDFSALKALGYDVSPYEALWNAQMEEKLNPEQDVEDGTEDDVVDAYMAQDNGVSDTNPFNQPQKTTPDFVETPAMVTPSTIPNQREDKANEGKSDVQIATENAQTASEIKEQQKPEALYERFLNGGQLTAKELETVQKKYGKEMQSAQVLYRRYQSGGTLTAKEREIVEKAYGKNVFDYGDTYGIKR